MPLVIKTVVINRVLSSSQNYRILSEVSCNPPKTSSFSNVAPPGHQRGDGQHFPREGLSGKPQTPLVYHHWEKTARRASCGASLVKSAETDVWGRALPAPACLPHARGGRTPGLGARSDITP